MKNSETSIRHRENSNRHSNISSEDQAPNRLGQELYEANPHSESLKNGLAISYSKLGDIYQAQGKFEQALQYFERRAQLGQELYEANPLSLKLEDGLAISYSKLGGIHQAMKQPQMARKFYQTPRKYGKS